MHWWDIVKLLVIVRKQLILIFTLSTYMLAVYYFFVYSKILIWLMFAVLFFILAHYFIIELKKTAISNLILIILAATVLLLAYIGIDNIFYTLWVIIFNIWVLFLFLDIYEEAYNRIEISSWKLFTMGSKMFSLILSLTFAFSFLWTYRTFNLTCNQIYDSIQKTSEFLSRYFDKEIPSFNKDVKVKEIISNIKPQETTVFTGIKLKYFFDPNFIKQAVVNQIVSNKKILDKSICEIIVSNIKEKYTKPWFQFTVMFLIFLLFYPLIRVVIFILAIVNWLMFQLAKFAKIYKYKKVVEEVEILE